MKISAPFSPKPLKSDITFSFPKDSFESESMISTETGRNLKPFVALKRTHSSNSYQFVEFGVGTVYSDK